MGSTEQDGAVVRIPPPLVYATGVLAGILLQRFALPLPLGLPRAIRIGLAAAFALVGIGLMLGAIRLFQRTGQDPRPWKSTPEIISGGIYAYTRNPMYVGMALLQATLGVGLSNGWIVLLILPVLITVRVTAIRHEEAYLTQKFGQAYTDYRASVRRWL